MSGTVSLPLSALIFGFFLAVIALRGYLVPYTPTLTKRYLPDSVLRRFEKHPPDRIPMTRADTDAGVDTGCLSQTVSVV
jgi:hypothetical protein